MAAIVALTGLAGLVSSIVALQLGMTSMPWRYLLSGVVAYGAFLALVRRWLDDQMRSTPRPPSRDSGILDLGPWPDGGSIGDAASCGPGLDLPAPDSLEGAPFLVLGLVVALVVIVAGWLVYAAPDMLAEMLLDYLLAAGLYRRLRRIDRRHWLGTVLRQTALPFAIVVLAMIAVGWYLQHIHPGAFTLGAAL